MALLYSAPMEGVTCSVWRRAHRKIFGGADLYMAPFIEPNQNMKLSAKDKREIGTPSDDLIPQILTNRSEYFVKAAQELFSMGYKSVNLNLGCPSGTVTAKHKGSGALADKAELDRMLYGIFSALPTENISIKTRIGYKSPEEWEELLSIYLKYPINCLIIHPRTKDMMYEGKADRNLFKDTSLHTNLHLVYNGDIFTPDDEAFSWGCDLMAGRGLASNPALFREAKGGDKASREELKAFSSLIFEGYSEYMSGDKPVIMRMKELWTYLSPLFPNSAKAIKAIKKAVSVSDYNDAVAALFRE